METNSLCKIHVMMLQYSPFIPGKISNMLLYTGKIIKHKWENCMTVDKRAWTHRRKIQIEDVMSIEELLAKIAETVR